MTPHNYRKWLIGVAAVFLVSFAARVSALRNSYVIDDFKLIVRNDFITQWGNLAILADPRYLFKPYPVVLGARPLTVASLMLDYKWWKLDPFGFHLTNILLHSANSVLVLLVAALLLRNFRESAGGGGPPARKTPFAARAAKLLRSLLRRYAGRAAAGAAGKLFPSRRGRPGGRGAAVPVFSAALVAALAFSLHPVQTEAVNTASFRADLLVAFFSLVSIAFFILASEQRGIKALLLCLGAVAAFSLGMFSKEMAIMVPLVFLLYRALLSGRAFSRQNLVIISLFGVLSVLFILLFWSSRVNYPLYTTVYPNIENNLSPMTSVPAYVNTLLLTFLHNAKTLLLPVRLSVDYSLPVASSFFSFGTFFSLFLLALCALVFAFSGDRWLKFGLGFSCLTYLPMSNLIPLANTVNDRYLYLPAAGFAMALSASLFALPPLKKPFRRLGAPLVAACLVLSWYGALSARRNLVFRDSYSLYSDAAAKAPHNIRVRHNLGVAHMARKEYREAINEFETLQQLNPLYRRSDVWHMEGTCYDSLGDHKTAKEFYLKALLINPKKDTIKRYAALLAGDGNLRGATLLLSKSMELNPDPYAFNDLGTYYARMGNNEKAMECFKKAIEMKPNYDNPWLNRLIMYKRQGKKRLYEKEAREMVELYTRNGWPLPRGGQQ